MNIVDESFRAAFPSGCRPVVSPLYDARPVIVVHLGTDGAPHLAACSGEVFNPERTGEYPDVPRVTCPACIRGARS